MAQSVKRLLAQGWRLYKQQGTRALIRRACQKATGSNQLMPALVGAAGSLPPAVPAFALRDSTTGVWLVIDKPASTTVQVLAGVLAFRGWAWSRAGRAGTLSVEVQSGGQVLRYPIQHRYRRADLARSIPEIPSVNYAGFEFSLDRFDLPADSQVTVVFETPSGTRRSDPFSVTAGRGHWITLDDLQSIPCDCCGGTDLVVVGKKDGLSLSRCQNCGLVFTSPRPDMARVSQRYSEDYFEREYLPDIRQKLGDLKPHWSYILDQVDRYKAVAPALFEVGTGAGFLLQMAAQRGWTVSGIDLNGSAVKHARSLGLDVRQGDIHETNLRCDHFGAILLESTLEHFMSPRQVLATCAQALVPGGGLFIWTLGYEGDLFLTEGMDLPVVGPSEHLYYFSASSLIRLCESVGLRVDHFWRDSTYDSVALVATKRMDKNDT